MRLGTWKVAPVGVHGRLFFFRWFGNFPTLVSRKKVLLFIQEKGYLAASLPDSIGHMVSMWSGPFRLKWSETYLIKFSKKKAQDHGFCCCIILELVLHAFFPCVSENTDHAQLLAMHLWKTEIFSERGNHRQSMEQQEEAPSRELQGPLGGCAQRRPYLQPFNAMPSIIPSRHSCTTDYDDGLDIDWEPILIVALEDTCQASEEKGTTRGEEEIPR